MSVLVVLARAGITVSIAHTFYTLVHVVVLNSDWACFMPQVVAYRGLLNSNLFPSIPLSVTVCSFSGFVSNDVNLKV